MAPGLMAPAKLGMAHAPAFFQCVVPGSLILISLVLITSFGPWSLPQMVQKFYSIRSKADVKRAMIIAGVFSLFMAGGAYYTGALTHLYYAKGLPAAIMQNGKPNLDLLMPAFIMEHVPYWLVLIILLLVFSASMSSLSSLVLVSSSAIAVDIFGAFAGSRTVRIMRTAFWTLTAVLGLVAADQAARSAQAFIMSKVTSAAIVQMQGTGELFLPQAAQELYARAASLNQLAIGHLVGFAFAAGFAVYIFLWLRSPSEKLLGDVKLALMRILCAVFVAISLWIAMSKVDVIVNLMVMSWGSLAGVFMAPYIYGLFWKRTTRAGVYAGIITGLVSAFTLFWAWGSPGVPLAGAITMFLPMLVVPIVSLMTKPPKQEIIDTAFGIEKAAGEESKVEAAI
jgi:Na+/proline symporter